MLKGRGFLSDGRPKKSMDRGVAASASASSRTRAELESRQSSKESRKASKEEVILSAPAATGSSSSSVPPRDLSTGDREDDSNILSGTGLLAGEVEVQQGNSDVWLHIYHCDPYTGFLNRHVLKNAEIGIYHAGVEIYGEEWSFQYFEDTWNDPSVSGLIRCMPKRMTDYEYQESVNLGPTPLSEEEVDQLLLSLHYEWPACSYHLTHNNCLTFAEYFSKRLQVPGDFPAWLKGILDASQKSQSVDAIVDYSWSWVKWYMIRKHRQADEEPVLAFDANRSSTLPPWMLFLQPVYSCSGSPLCPGGLRRPSEQDSLDFAQR